MSRGAPPRRRPPSVVDLAPASPWLWLAVLAAALPWLSPGVEGWPLYPGHLLLALVLAVRLAQERVWPAALPPLAPLLLLGAWVALLSAVRGAWAAALMTLGAVAAQFCWGAAAYRLALARRDAAPARDGLLLLLAAALGVGLLFWGVQALWPPVCRVLACDGAAAWPYAFRGGFPASAQYLLFLLFLLPALAPTVILLHRQGGRAGTPLRLMTALAAAAGLGLLAGAAWWMLLVVVAGLALLAWVLAPTGRREDRRLVRALAIAVPFAAVVFYGLLPAYLPLLGGARQPAAVVRVALAGQAPRRLSSERPAAVAVRVTNAGWRALGRNGHAALVVRPDLVITPERGPTRTVPLEAVPLDGDLAPGETREVTLPVRVPHWVREGYLAWHVEAPAGAPVRIAEDSQAGFRFRNAGYRRLQLDRDNRLSALLARARDYSRQARPAVQQAPDAHSLFMVLGDAFDTLFFSPLWGEAERHAASPHAFGAPRPFWLQLFHRYGLVALALALWAGWRVQRRAWRLAWGAEGDHARLTWALVPVALALLFLAGWFTPELGSYHALWAFFLLAGWVEGRHALMVPRPAPRHSVPRRRSTPARAAPRRTRG